jgi:hypothetical protein
MKGWKRHCRMICKKIKGWNRHCPMIGLKMMGWNRHCRMIGLKKEGRIRHCRFIESFSNDLCPALNTPFGGFSTGLRGPNQLAAMAEFWFSVDWLPYLPDLNSMDFSTSSVLQPKGQATPHANLAALRLSVAVEWDRLAVVRINKTCRSFCRRR